VIALNALEKERGVKVGWGEFLRIGGVLMLIQAVLVMAYLSIFSVFDLFPK
jgi:Na+/H+ antiporter NhaD/arsenite permease-like protein